MRARDREAVEDEDCASDLEEEMEDVRTGHQQADDDASDCGDLSATVSALD